MWSGSQESPSLWNSPVLRKWLNLRSPADNFASDDNAESPLDSPTPSIISQGSSVKTGLLSEDGATPLGDAPAELAPWMKISGFKEELQRVRREYIDKEDVKIVAATWNVAGLPPPSDLDLDDWLRVHEDPPPDIYVIGFQEIVPLTANNVLGLEYEQSGKLWNEKLRSALERTDTSFVSVPLSPGPYSRTSSLNPRALDLGSSPADRAQNGAANHAGSLLATPSSQGGFRDMADLGSGELHRHLSGMDRTHPGADMGDSVRVAEADLAMFDTPRADADSADPNRFSSDSSRFPSSQPSPLGAFQSPLGQRRYRMVASKQMVGLHLVVWVRTSLRRHVSNVKVACVATGILGVLGNKGSVAVSLSLHETTFCFVCAHLTAGEKEADNQKRVLDLQEVLRRTLFFWGDAKEDGRLRKLPETIQEHDRVIWVGDLNFRLDLPDADVRTQLGLQSWESLLRKDQLRMEMGRGGALEGWREADVTFPPTYKYAINSKKYVGEDAEDGDKRRTPAWCDRILWYGEGLRCLHYGRSEILVSDHRPVTAVMAAEVHRWTNARWREAIARARSLVDARAQRTVPHCRVEPQVVVFGEVKYAREVGGSVELHNVGEVAARFHVGPPPGDVASDTPWVRVEPSEGTVAPGEVRTLHLRACVSAPETDVQRVVQSATRELSAIQVVRLENGGDLFLFCSATYLPSCWGLSLETLASIPGPVRDLPPAAANGDARSFNGATTSIPKELQRMVAYLLEAGMEGPSTFDTGAVGIDPSEWDGSAVPSPGSLQMSESFSSRWAPSGQVSWQAHTLQLERKVALVREALDTGAPFPPGTTPQLMGTTLVLFLRALPQSVISPEAMEAINRLEASGRKPSPMEILEQIEIDGLPLMVLDALLVLIQALLRNRIANQFAIKEMAAVFASAIFPQQGGIDKKTYRQRTKFLKDLIEQRLNSK